MSEDVTQADYEAERTFMRSNDCPLSVKMTLGVKPGVLARHFRDHRIAAAKAMQEASTPGTGGPTPKT